MTNALAPAQHGLGVAPAIAPMAAIITAYCYAKRPKLSGLRIFITSPKNTHQHNTPSEGEAMYEEH